FGNGRCLSRPDPQQVAAGDKQRRITSATSGVQRPMIQKPPPTIGSICIVVDADSLSAFVPALAQQIVDHTGAQVKIRLVAGIEDGSSALDTLLALEKMVVRRGKPCWSDRIP